MEPNETGARKVVIGIVVVIIIAIGAIVWLSTRDGANDNSAAVGSAFDRAAAIRAGRTATITVGSQLPAASVYVSQVDLPEGGWVVVRRNDSGVVGSVIGAGYFDANTRAGTIDLIEKLEEGKNYFVELYADNGDDRFSVVEDALLEGPDGNPLRVTFLATENLPEIKG